MTLGIWFLSAMTDYLSTLIFGHLRWPRVLISAMTAFAFGLAIIIAWPSVTFSALGFFVFLRNDLSAFGLAIRPPTVV